VSSIARRISGTGKNKLAKKTAAPSTERLEIRISVSVRSSGSFESYEKSVDSRDQKRR
jgi:hypothetical protein